MDHSKFEAALTEIIQREPRYDRAAYHFLRESLDFTLKERKKATGQAGHVSGHQLLDGIRRYALKQFGPMVPTVFEHWGLQTTEDFGRMVFALVDAAIFSTTENDTLEDFKGAYTFHDAFVVPFIPAPRVLPTRRITVDSPARELN
jgi:uncharacterized repeat protein (TIGR04138 family)